MIPGYTPTPYYAIPEVQWLPVLLARTPYQISPVSSGRRPWFVLQGMVFHSTLWLWPISSIRNPTARGAMLQSLSTTALLPHNLTENLPMSCTVKCNSGVLFDQPKVLLRRVERVHHEVVMVSIRVDCHGYYCYPVFLVSVVCLLVSSPGQLPFIKRNRSSRSPRLFVYSSCSIARRLLRYSLKALLIRATSCKCSRRTSTLPSSV